MRRRFMKDVFFLPGWRRALRVSQPVIVFRVRGYHKAINPPKPKVHLTDLGMQPCKLGF